MPTSPPTEYSPGWQIPGKMLRIEKCIEAESPPSKSALPRALWHGSLPTPSSIFLSCKCTPVPHHGSGQEGVPSIAYSAFLLQECLQTHDSSLLTFSPGVSAGTQLSSAQYFSRDIPSGPSDSTVPLIGHLSPDPWSSVLPSPSVTKRDSPTVWHPLSLPSTPAFLRPMSHLSPLTSFSSSNLSPF